MPAVNRVDWHGGWVRSPGMLGHLFPSPMFPGVGHRPVSLAWCDLMQSFGESPGKVKAAIVLAEDDADLRRILAECLRREGHLVWEACDGGEAVNLVRTHAPALLLLDIWMPVLNGLEVLEHLGRTSEAVGVKVVVLSNLGDADTRLEGFALGVADYWTKDLSLVEFCERVQHLLERALVPPSHPG